MYLKGVDFATHGIMFRNILDKEDGREYFSTIIKCSDYVDDATSIILILMKGKSFTLSDCTCCYRIVEEKEGGHNYNSLFSAFRRVENEIESYNNFHKYFPKVNLTGLYAKSLVSAWNAARKLHEKGHYKKMHL